MLDAQAKVSYGRCIRTASWVFASTFRAVAFFERACSADPSSVWRSVVQRMRTIRTVIRKLKFNTKIPKIPCDCSFLCSVQITSNPYFKGTPLFDVENVRNDTRWAHCYFRPLKKWYVSCWIVPSPMTWSIFNVISATFVWKFFLRVAYVFSGLR